MSTKKCHECGYELDLDSKFCVNCGAQLTANLDDHNLIGNTEDSEDLENLEVPGFPGISEVETIDAIDEVVVVPEINEVGIIEETEEIEPLEEISESLQEQTPMIELEEEELPPPVQEITYDEPLPHPSMKGKRIKKDPDSPLSTFQYFLMYFLTFIPIIGFIFFLVWSLSGRVNSNRRNFSRSVLLMILLSFLFFTLLIFVFMIYWQNILNLLSDFLKSSDIIKSFFER